MHPCRATEPRLPEQQQTAMPRYIQLPAGAPVSPDSVTVRFMLADGSQQVLIPAELHSPQQGRGVGDLESGEGAQREHEAEQEEGEGTGEREGEGAVEKATEKEKEGEGEEGQEDVM